MSNSLQGDCRRRDAYGGGSRVNNVKCRIPQLLPQNQISVNNEKPKAASETAERSMRSDGTSPTIRCPALRNPIFRVKHTESGKSNAIQQQRPKSAASRKEEVVSPPRQLSSIPRTSRPVDRGKSYNTSNVQKFNMKNKTTAPLIPKKTETQMSTAKASRPIITGTVPYQSCSLYGTRRIFQKGDIDELPDQETIKRCEDLEIQRQLSGITEIVQELKDGGPIKLSKDKIQLLKDTWQNNIQMFERMKSDLNERQKTLIDLYATMKSVHQIMAAKGQKIQMPSAAEVKFMSMSESESVLQFSDCQNKTPSIGTDKPGTSSASGTLSPIGKNSVIDLNRLYNLPTKLLDICEKTLAKRKEIIDWFESLKNEGKGIRMGKLNKKIDEFNAENEMLECILKNDKNEVIKELSSVIDYFRSTVTDTINSQLRSEELTYEIMDLNAKNSELKKQIHNSEHLKSSNLRNTIEKLEKELKEERCKKELVRDRLSRAEGQVKTGAEALKQANMQICNLELALQQLQDQNNTLQVDFEKEINTLSESIKENTAHLEEIAEAREKLQSEKDNLEKRLSELSDNYNDSLQALKEELNLNVTKVTETELKFEEEKGERIKLEVKLERLCGQLFSAELRYKELLTQLEEKDNQINKLKARQMELDSVKEELNNAHMGIEEYRNKLERHAEKLQNIEIEYQQVLNTQTDLRRELGLKEDQLKEKEIKMEHLTRQLHESEGKMISYEEQLMSLKSHLADLQQEFGEFQSIPELHDMVNKQREKVLEVTRENGDLVEALNRKELELERHIDNLNELEQLIEQKEGVVKVLSQKEEEQANIIQYLRDNLEIRTKADNELSQKMIEKESILETYSAEVETKNQKISQLEMLILTLEEQLRKVNLVRTRELDKIKLLEKTIADYETYQMDSKLNAETPTENLDNLIKILENELCTPFNTHISTMEPKHKKKVEDAKKHYNPDKMELHEGHPTGHVKTPTNIMMGNFIKKTYISTNEEQQKGDNLDRKKAITNMNTQRMVYPNMDTDHWRMPREAEKDFFNYPQAMTNETAGIRSMVPMPPSRNLPYISPNYYRDEKKSKMFKFAGHRM